VVTGWALCVIPLLSLSLGYLLLHLPGINRALWHSGSRQAHLLSAAISGHRYVMATIDVIGLALLVMSFAGSVYVMTALGRRLAAVGVRWSAGHRGRRLLLAAASLACITALAGFWTTQGQFHGW
jgi:hypothetical protein